MYYYSVPLEVQIAISRLEIPADIQISSYDIPNDISITAQIISNQMVMHEAVLSTHFAIADEFRNSLVWDYVMSFPLKIKDLAVNSVVTFTARTPDNRVIGGTTMHFFDENGSLKKGKQKLIFFFGTEGDPNVLYEFNKTPGDLYEKYSEWDYSFKMEKFIEVYKPMLSSDRDTPRIDWLDRLTLSHIQNTLGNAVSRNSRKIQDDYSADDKSTPTTAFGYSYEELDLQSFCCLVVEFPTYPYPILYEDRTYSAVVIAHNPPTQVAAIAQGAYIDNNETGALEFSFTSTRQFNINSLVVIADWDVGQENLCEDMHRRMNHSTLRSNFDVHIKPNLSEKEAIDIVIQKPANHLMSYEDMDLLYRFRYSLTDNKKALTKFLMAVDWTSDSEVAELPILLSKWKEKATIDVSDALKLLGREKCYQHPTVREYAVEVLQVASDEDLLKYLLQLVQALRYEPSRFSVTNDQGQQVQSRVTDVISSNSTNLSPLARFLINRGFKSPIVANFLHWYLKVETEDEVMGSMFQEIFDTFMIQLSSNGEDGRQIARQLEAQADYIAKICQCQREARECGRRKNDKEIALRRLLSEKNLAKVPMKGISSVPLPLIPEKQVSGLNPSTATMFASAVYPCVIEFYVEPNDTNSVVNRFINKTNNTNDDEDAKNRANDNISVTTPTVKQTHKIMIKSGDDLRQDQLIMQMISLMDALLKSVNLDLRLLTYGILAVSQNDGIMEFVSGSMPISGIMKNHNSLSNFLRLHNPDDSGPYGINVTALETFVKSCAGYCVISYILGIGDRHLDNLMMTKSGELA